IRPVEEGAGDRQAVACIVAWASGERRQCPTVIVAEMRQLTAVARKNASSERQPSGDALELRSARVAGHACNGERQQVEIERVLVIVRRSLAVAAVGRNLPVGLTQK